MNNTETRSRRLPGLPYRIEEYEVLSSTNEAAKQRAINGEPEGLVIIAKAQTFGRGRGDHSFYSPAGTGLYMSILLRPSTEKVPYLTTAIAVAAAEALEEISGKRVLIKWVNDLYVNGKKVSGILTEGSFSADGSFEYAIIGIGINLFYPNGGFPMDISGKAGAVFDSFDPSLYTNVIDIILSKLYQYYVNFDPAELLKEYKQRCFVIGKRISAEKGGKTLYGTALDIDDEMHLTVKWDNGNTEALNSGEISIVPIM